jgi:hypothetical protein
MWNDVRTETAETDVLEKSVFDMRGRQVKITETYTDADGRTIEKGEAFVYNGNTGPLPSNKIPLIFGEGNISSFYPVDRAKIDDPVSGIRTPASLGKIGSGEPSFYF